MRIGPTPHLTLARLRPLPLVIGALLCTGCLYVPLAGDKALEGKQITLQEQQIVRPGVTTRGELVAALGEPQFEWENERILAYRWRTRMGVLILAGSGGVGAFELPKDHMLLVQLDASDRVSRLEQVPESAFRSFGEQVRQWASSGARPP